MHREIVYDPVFDGQRHYRQLLDCMARPGKLNRLDRMDLQVPGGIHEGATLMAFALLNADVTFFATGQYAGEVGAYLKTQTFASPVSAEEADFLFLNGADAMWICQAKKGTLSYPEEGATLVLSVDQLAPDGSGVDQLAPDGGRRWQDQETDLSQGLRLRLTGPGIEKETHLGVWGLSRDFFKEWTACNQEFPLGVDLILADKSGRICALPRSTQINTIQLWDM
jgi:alpha-D-ribose 1-methylphosphonate 5-triphosphate synthase subunit PhnH